MPNGAFNEDFGPVVRPGDVLELSPIGEYRVVEGYNVLPGVKLQNAFNINANSDEKRELTELEMDDGFLAQYRLPRLPEELPDGVYVEVDHGGRQNPAFETKNARGRWTNETGVDYSWDPGAAAAQPEDFRSEQTEFYVHTNHAPYFTVTNDTANAITFDPTFEGFAYDLGEISAEEATSGGRQPVVVPVESER